MDNAQEALYIGLYTFIFVIALSFINNAPTCLDKQLEFSAILLHNSNRLMCVCKLFPAFVFEYSSIFLYNLLSNIIICK